jgi:hypothetical protein
MYALDWWAERLHIGEPLVLCSLRLIPQPFLLFTFTLVAICCVAMPLLLVCECQSKGNLFAELFFIFYVKYNNIEREEGERKASMYHACTTHRVKGFTEIISSAHMHTLSSLKL